jgi:sensor domain CHASE-containing protein
MVLVVLAGEPVIQVTRVILDTTDRVVIEASLVTLATLVTGVVSLGAAVEAAVVLVVLNIPPV